MTLSTYGAKELDNAKEAVAQLNLSHQSELDAIEEKHSKIIIRETELM